MAESDGAVDRIVNDFDAEVESDARTQDLMAVVEVALEADNHTWVVTSGNCSTPAPLWR
jgi:hypothetical protein